MTPLVLSRPLVIVSTHLDDAVLSCARLLASNPGCRVITVCASAPEGPAGDWDRTTTACERARDANACRRAEDVAALALVGATPVWLDLADSQYAGEKRPHSPIRAALLDALERAAPATVVAPLGLCHPDHVAVADVCRGLVRSLDADWYCYLDMPYAQSVLGALDARLREVDRHVRLDDCATEELEAPSVKADAVACYTSQVAALRAVLPEFATALHDRERYWRMYPRP